MKFNDMFKCIKYNFVFEKLSSKSEKGTFKACLIVILKNVFNLKRVFEKKKKKVLGKFNYLYCFLKTHLIDDFLKNTCR